MLVLPYVTNIMGSANCPTTSAPPGLIMLDRDGVLNNLVIDPDHGTIDSPLHPNQVSLLPGVSRALKTLTQKGYILCIVTNQPAAAKGKVHPTQLRATHDRVVELCQQEGGHIQDSFICWHRHEDNCSCRKPQPGLLNAALAQYGKDLCRPECWMVGDGITDLQAGNTVGVKVGFINKRRCDACRIVKDAALSPDFWGEFLSDFVEALTGVPKANVY